MGPPAGCGWVPRLPVAVGHGGCEPGMCSFNTRYPARHLLEGTSPHPAGSGSRGRRVSHTVGPFADSGRLAVPGCVLQGTPLPTPASARPWGTGHSRCSGSLEVLGDAGELVAMP